MEATYNIGSDVDVCRMFDQYLYKRNENVDLSLSVSHSHVNGYSMNDQTFHTPSFGDEEFDIPPINPHQTQPQPQHHQEPQQHNNLTYQQLHSQQQQQQQQREYEYQQQQQQYIDQYNNYMPQSNQMMMMQQGQTMMLQPQQQGVYLRSPTGASPPVGQEATTTSEDSDDSTPHPAMIAAMKRPSPEPVDGGGKALKKPKVQKKKKKRDPNEPQKPVSAYALFFRDTQAAIKGQNPNASFGEVSKIVASMWDALDADSKNVYKKKTEAAKKDYLKALAIYRASIVSKGAPEGEGMYGQYGGYVGGGGYSGYSPPTGLPSPPHMQQQQQQQMTNMAKKSPLLTNMMTERAQNGQPQQGMLGSQMGHMQAPMQSPNTGYMQQVATVPSPDPPPSSVAGQGGQLGPSCIRHGCANPAITNPEWEDEYCSNECVVEHCRDVFSSWVASQQQQKQNPAVK